MNCVDYRCEAGVAFCTLNAPDSQNALTLELVDELSASISRASWDQSCRVVILAANGPDFCSGLDLGSDVQMGAGSIRKRCLEFTGCLQKIMNCPKPVIACVESRVTGGGLGLMAVCDTIVSSTHASFIMPEVLVGVIPALITPFLMRRMSLARIRHMALSTQVLTATDAHSFGLVDQVVENGIPEAVQLHVRRILRSSPEAIAQTKRYLAELDGGGISERIELAIERLIERLSQPEVAKALHNYSEGLTPPWFQRGN